MYLIIIMKRGNIENGKPHGYGINYFSDGVIYEGSWIRNI